MAGNGVDEDRQPVLVGVGQWLQREDDLAAAMVEALGTEVKVFMGSYENMKITTPEDVSRAEAIHAARTRPSGQSA